MQNDPFPMAVLDEDATNLLFLWKDTPAGYVLDWLINQGIELYFNVARQRICLRTMQDKRRDLLKKRLYGYQGLY